MFLVISKCIKVVSSFEIKRFTNRDVPSGSIDDGLTMNCYAYGNPISYINPFGLRADSDKILKTVGSFLADATTLSGKVKGVQEVLTGQELSVRDRVATGVGTLVSFIPDGKDSD